MEKLAPYSKNKLLNLILAFITLTVTAATAAAAALLLLMPLVL
jgi:hypothetical protein